MKEQHPALLLFWSAVVESLITDPDHVVTLKIDHEKGGSKRTFSFKVEPRVRHDA